jgi:hypothetical protein
MVEAQPHHLAGPRSDAATPTAAPVPPTNSAGPGGADAEWPWPDLEARLPRPAKPGPGWFIRLLRRGRRD